MTQLKPLLNQFLSVDFPLIQAPMAGSQDHRLAAAVAQAGGLGSIPSAMLTPDALASQLSNYRAMTDRPVNVNFFTHTSPTPDEAIDKAWQTLLSPYDDELGIDRTQTIAGASRLPFNHAIADVLDAFKPEVVSFHFGLPAPDLLARVKSWDALVMSSATTIEEARWLERNGADIVIAQGLEAGGHRGHFLGNDVLDISAQMGTFALLPQIIRAVNVPVVAAGGIADAAGVRAAMGWGAAGVQIGTSFLLCNESNASPVHRAALSSEMATHTCLTNLFTGRPARSIVNRIMREMGAINRHVPLFPLATTAITPLRAAAEAKGSMDFSPLWAGQNTSGCQAISATELTLELAKGFD